MPDIIGMLFPELFVIALITPLTIISIFIFLYISGTLKLTKKLKTNYTRKVFHILVFTEVSVVGYFFGFQAVMLYGGITGLILILVLYLGDGHVFFEGLAREQDVPFRKFYIGIPFLMTAIAGILNNYLFFEFALVGYLVAGWGDAAGEPFGVRFGKHKYKVPTIRKVYCERSIEGSTAILLVSAFGAGLALFLIGFTTWYLILGVAILAGGITALVEAVSPHGIDNLTTQFGSAMVCYLLLGCC
jgi:phytol kinase